MPQMTRQAYSYVWKNLTSVCMYVCVYAYVYVCVSVIVIVIVMVKGLRDLRSTKIRWKVRASHINK